jgi:hypothetical protein
MKAWWTEKVWLGLSVLLVFGGMGPGFSSSQAAAPLSANEVIRKAVAHAQQAETRTGLPAYSYSKVTVTEELDSTGKVKERKERMYQVWFRDGATYVKLLKVNGRTPATADMKLQADNESSLRLLVGGSKGANGDRRENCLTPELVAHYDFTLVGETPLNGRRAYRLAFQPKAPALPTHHIIDRFLNRISGTIWIDAEEFEIARAELRLGSEVDLLGGVVGCLKKLAYTLTRTRVADGLWLNTYSSGDFEGRKLLDSLRIKTKSQSVGFRPLEFPS